ncbi:MULTISPECIES: rhodanese-like domain-containing protein [unclassified Moritella]|uniref:rhodanese-like domain-containing protein n=1 Tax=unclassified Moritella TaxID=2637987 RepID=UPI001BA7A7BD|nr:MULTISPECIES: rhodanese-like domain-containing protein [unclassified Moritella]QUM86483.1 sulfurtransferase [Moritella sp. 28]QUM90708.1 sulfurtransferase [Moritella sp. 36]
MPSNTNTFSYQAEQSQKTHDFFATKLACETDCSDVYADIKADNKNYILLDVRSTEAFNKSHAITAESMPHSDINHESFAKYDEDTLFVVYCWGPGCNGASRAALKISALGFVVKEMIGGIHYWEDFERYPVNRRLAEVQR